MRRTVEVDPDAMVAAITAYGLAAYSEGEAQASSVHELNLPAIRAIRRQATRAKLTACLRLLRID